jgi:hypothetical protein
MGYDLLFRNYPCLDLTATIRSLALSFSVIPNEREASFEMRRRTGHHIDAVSFFAAT